MYIRLTSGRPDPSSFKIPIQIATENNAYMGKQASYDLIDAKDCALFLRQCSIS